jgi:L-fuconolactonase
MPDVTVDAHVHVWDPSALDYPWLDALPTLRRRFGPEEYAASLGGAPARRAVFVECNCRPEQNADEVRLAERVPLVVGIVAFADVAALGRAALDTLSDSPRLKGVRQNVQGQPPGFCLAPPFVDGVREAARRGLAFDLCATHDQLGDVIELVRRCPDARFVLDHCGKPAIRDGAIASWARDVALLAAHDNVCCKLSGLLTEASPRWTETELLPYAEQVIDAFGPGRLLYGSDWPVLTLAGTHADWYAFTRRVTAAWSDAERAAFYGENAVHVYGL